MLQNIDTTMTLEFFGEVSIYFGIGVQIVFALILGGLVGFDREVKLKAAGLKTNIMICLGACLYTTISMINIDPSNTIIDPNRVSAQIVSGIGFLGAGAIIQGRGSVTGLTTAATIWVVAAIGYTIGVGYPIVASLFSITVLIVLKMINPVNKIIERKKDFQYFHIELLTHVSAHQSIINILTTEDLDICHTEEHLHSAEKKQNIVDIYVFGHYRALERVSAEFSDSVKIQKSSFRQVEELPEDIQNAKEENNKEVKIA